MSTQDDKLRSDFPAWLKGMQEMLEAETTSSAWQNPAQRKLRGESRELTVPVSSERLVQLIQNHLAYEIPAEFISVDPHRSCVKATVYEEYVPVDVVVSIKSAGEGFATATFENPSRRDVIRFLRIVQRAKASVQTVAASAATLRMQPPLPEPTDFSLDSDDGFESEGAELEQTLEILLAMLGSPRVEECEEAARLLASTAASSPNSRIALANALVQYPAAVSELLYGHGHGPRPAATCYPILATLALIGGCNGVLAEVAQALLQLLESFTLDQGASAKVEQEFHCALRSLQQQVERTRGEE